MKSNKTWTRGNVAYIMLLKDGDLVIKVDDVDDNVTFCAVSWMEKKVVGKDLNVIFFTRYGIVPIPSTDIEPAKKTSIRYWFL